MNVQGATNPYARIFGGSNVRILLDATNPAGRTLDTSGSETYAALQNLAPGWGAESITNGTKASQPTSTNDAGTGLKGILMLGDSQLLSGNITAVNGDVFSWVVWRANGFVNNRQLISLSNSTAANQQWFSTPLGFLPMTSGFSADVFGAWHPNNYHNLWRNNADFKTFSNTADRGALDRLGIGTALGSFRGPYTFFEFGLVTGNPTSGQRNALHALLQSKYTGL